MTSPHTPTAPRHKLPVEIWQLILDHFEPTKETYVVDQPWKRTASESTLAALTQVCWRMRCIALPLVWKYVYLETMEEWGLLWKRICPESGQHICAFINFWTTPALPFMAMDDVESYGKDMLWYAFAARESLPIGRRGRYWSKLNSGPDNRGFKSVIESPEMYRQACKEVSGMWSRKLRTIYWDASTSFSEDVILNIRRIQETSSSYKDYPGLQSLWIDFFQERVRSDSILRCYWTFKEPVWRLGEKTLGQLKFFSICPPHWPAARKAFEYDRAPKGSFDNWPQHEDTLPPLRGLDCFSQISGPGRLLSTLRHLRPQIFFSMSEAPFQCKELLPCWARVRCIHIFENFTLTNSENFAKLDLVRDSHFFRPVRSGQIQLSPDSVKKWVDKWGEFAEIEFVRAAIQLRPTLEYLYRIKGFKPLTGDDVSSYAKSDVQNMSLRWTEDWQYRQPWGKRQRQQAIPVNNIGEVADDLHRLYKKWLCDPGLADKVAQSFNEGIEETAAEYPFRHPIYSGMLHEETSACSLLDTSEIWLDRHWRREDHQFRRLYDCEM